MVLLRPTRPSRTNSKNRCPFHHRGLECKSRKSRDIPGVTGEFGLEVQNEAEQRLTEFCQENTVVIANTLFQHQKRRFYSFKNIREGSTHGHHQMVNPEIRLIILFAAKDGEALYSEQKQDWELTVAQIMNSLLSNSTKIESFY